MDCACVTQPSLTYSVSLESELVHEFIVVVISRCQAFGGDGYGLMTSNSSGHFVKSIVAPLVSVQVSIVNLVWKLVGHEMTAAGSLTQNFRMTFFSLLHKNSIYPETFLHESVE